MSQQLSQVIQAMTTLMVMAFTMKPVLMMQAEPSQISNLPSDKQIADAINQLESSIGKVSNMIQAMGQNEKDDNPKLDNSLNQAYRDINMALLDLSNARMYRYRIQFYGNESWGMYPTSEEL